MSKKPKRVLSIGEYNLMIAQQQPILGLVPSVQSEEPPEPLPGPPAPADIPPDTTVPAEATSPVSRRLATILRWKRSHGSVSEMAFCKWVREEITRMGAEPKIREAGCITTEVLYPDGKRSSVLFSCHMDTMHGAMAEGRQELLFDPTLEQIFLDEASRKAPGSCLGADDGVGVWMMLDMIQNKKPGSYIFHRGEERGGIGSRAVLANDRDWLEQFDLAVAFDRPGVDEVITHQGGQRCASDKAGEALVKALKAEGMIYEMSTKGVFTDTKVYRGVISECFNIGVGYEFQHGPQECLDYGHACRLLGAVKNINWDSIPAERDPKEVEPWNGYQGRGAWDEDGYGGWYPDKVKPPFPSVGAVPPSRIVPPKPIETAPSLSSSQELDGMTMEDIVNFCADNPEDAAEIMVNLMSDLAAAEARVGVLRRLVGVRA
jgi:hypothetical protein